MVNHKIGEIEWGDAKKVIISPSYDMYYKNDDNYYYLAFKGKDTKPFSFYVDLYLSSNDKLENIHASHQMGYRDLTGVEWSDEWSKREPKLTWGYQPGWIANTVSTNRDKMALLRKDKTEGNLYLMAINPYDGYEFQFSKQQWDLKNMKMRVAIRDLYVEDAPRTYYPQNSDKTDAENWLKLNWDN